MAKPKELETAQARTQRIAKLRNAIENGNYRVSAEVLAEKLFERMREGEDALADFELGDVR
jgi:anti-sigma28 factor (negative regulator of flagellin synthesis)